MTTTSTLHHAYAATIPGDHPARRRYDQAMLDVRQHLVDDERPPRLAWTDVDLFVAQHNWPDPASTQALAALIVHGFRGRHELRRLERQPASR